MWSYVAIGCGLAFTAAIQPGPTQAYLFSRAVAIGWRKTLPAAFAPLLSDGPIAIVALLLLGQLSAELQSVIRFAGGLLLIYFAWRSFQEWRQNIVTRPEPDGKSPSTLVEATMVQFLNPNPYIGWALILGPIVIDAWNDSFASSIAVLVSFYATLVITLGLTVYIFGSARHLGSRFQRSLLLVSALILAGLAVYQIAKGVEGFQ